VKTCVHLIEGERAGDRVACIARMAASSRRKVTVFAEAGDVPAGPLDWLMGAGCLCCLPGSHPRRRLMQMVLQGQGGRILIDGGPPALVDRIVVSLRALPVPLAVHVLAAKRST
jgi:hypothetical protein